MNLRRVAAGAAALGLLALLAGAGSATGATPSSPEVSKTKVVTREMQDDNGDKEVDGIRVTTVDQRTVTVTASKTHDLRGRESVHIAWSGARPSSSISGESGNPSTFERTEYPVVVLQCRGIDDSTGEIKPETCWTSTGNNRQMGGGSTANGSGTAAYMHDLYATEKDRAETVPEPETWKQVCKPNLPPDPERHIPFVSADSQSTTYWACTDKDLAPEMSLSGALPPNERVEPTHLNGTGFTDFEVRTSAENQSLGCSQGVACSIVVIPIMGISCRDADVGCRKTGHEPGSDYPGSSAPDLAVTGLNWASASNWRNRISIPLSFAPSANLCSVSDNRKPLQLYGTQLIVQAAAQWAPAYCTRTDRFKLQVNDQPEGTAFRNLPQGYGNGVVATYPPDSTGSVPLGFAPVAVTGFAIAFNVDQPNGDGPLEQLKLTPRLLAKLMTGSYPGFRPTPGVLDTRPDLADNPFGLQFDPEFLELNPSLAYDEPSWVRNVEISFASLLMPSVPSDTVHALTEYVASDPEAMAFLHGQPDPWGTTVNSAYRDIAMPRSEWPLLDAWLRPSANVCDIERPYGWFNRTMAPVSSLVKIAQDMLAGTPETLISYDQDINKGGVCVFSRSPQQFAPNRHMLGLVALSDAKLYGVRTAQLRTAGTGPKATFVGADDASMSAAVEAATQSGPGQPFLVDQQTLRTDHPDAYPGTMVLHVAAPLAKADATVSAKMAQFIKVATSEGQISGSGVGQLAPGYVPITSSGPTAALYSSAQVVALAIAAQAGPVAGTPEQGTDDEDTDTGSSSSSSGGSGVPDAAAAPVGAPDAVGPVDTSVTVQGEPAPEPTESVQATAAAVTAAPEVGGPVRAAVPAALGVALAAGIGAPLVRRYSTRRGPL